MSGKTSHFCQPNVGVRTKECTATEADPSPGTHKRGSLGRKGERGKVRAGDHTISRNAFEFVTPCAWSRLFLAITTPTVRAL